VSDAQPPSQNLPARVAGARELAMRGVSERVRRILDDGTPRNTRRAYQSDLRYVKAWCEASGIAYALPLPAEVLLQFVVDHVDEGMPPEVEEEMIHVGAKRSRGIPAFATLNRRFMAVSTAHRVANLDNPCRDRMVVEVLNRARRAALMSGRRPRKKSAAHWEILERLLATCGEDIQSVRDRAILLFAFSSGGRRSSEVSDAEFRRMQRIGGEWVYNLGLTKTSKDADAGPVPLAGAAGQAVEAWIRMAGITDGPLFRAVDQWGHVAKTPLSCWGVRQVVKRRAEMAGLDPSEFGAHSLRSGFMTETGLRGIALAEAMGLSRHRSIQVAAGYHQAGTGLNNRAARLAG
jgi:integrase